jgi:hypothetical protein
MASSSLSPAIPVACDDQDVPVHDQNTSNFVRFRIMRSRDPHLPSIRLPDIGRRPFRDDAVDQAVLYLLARQREFALVRVALLGVPRKRDPIASASFLMALLASVLFISNLS